MRFPELGDDGVDGRVRGVAVGVVTNNEDPEGLGRVKVTYPWREGDDESRWARVATLMAGEEMGAYFLPEVDDEVLVAFDDGDLDHPYVLGSLWNGKQPPPQDNADGTNDVRSVTSRRGHEIVLDDDATEGKVEIKTSSGHKIVLDDTTGSETVRIEDRTGANKIEFDAVSGSLDIKSGTSISIEAPSLELTGSGNVKIESSGVLTLKGALIQLN